MLLNFLQCRAALTAKKYPALKVNRAAVEKPCSGWQRHNSKKSR